MPEHLLDPALLSSIAHLELIARQAVEGTVSGLHHSHFMGRNVEFSEHRPYNPGDELRHIDWRAYAKTDRFHIKLFEEDTNLRALILTDLSGSMHFGDATIPKREYAQQLTAALSYLILAQGDSAGLAVFDHKIQTYIPPRSRVDQWGPFLEALTSTPQTTEETSICSVLSDITEWLTKRGLVILISDLIEDPEQVMKHLAMIRTAHQEVIVFHLLTPEEIEMPYTGTVEFLPLEHPQEALMTTPKRLRTSYREKVNRFIDTYRSRCMEFKIDYNLVRTDQPLDHVLREYLQQRLKIKVKL
ncbi:MAG: DUF58 domain-containing protein [bacterium]|nr:DUF58 domain-containing protein [bacterium]